MTYFTHPALLAPKGLRLKAQGCRFGYPGTKKMDSQPQGGCVGDARPCAGRNRFAVGGSDDFLPRVAEAATLGFESQPLWGKARNLDLKFEIKAAARPAALLRYVLHFPVYATELPARLAS